MTARNAIVLINGHLQELPAGDTLVGAGGGGGSASVYSVTLDFGVTPVQSKTFTFADGNAVTSSKIVMTCAGPADGRSFDEMEMDTLHCVAACLTNGVISVVVTGDPGPLTGKYKFNYLLG